MADDLPTPFPTMLRASGILALLASVASFGLPFASGLAQGQDTSCPLSFTATASGPGSVSFHWVGFGGAEGYQVFGRQGQGDTAGYSPMLGGDARDWTANNLASGDYVFWVDAFHSGTVVAESCERTATVQPTLAAACPSQVTATIEPPSWVFLQWSRVPDATGYRVARQVDAGAMVHDYAAVGQSNHPSFTDTAAPAGHSYTYLVSTQNTREPPEACAPVTADSAEVPFFPTPTAWAMAALVTLVVGTAIRRQ